MATHCEGAGKDDLKTQFTTREGTYKVLSLSEYSRPNRVGYNSQSNSPVKVSFVSLPDSSEERICFNVGRELYVYMYRGVKKVSWAPWNVREPVLRLAKATAMPV